MNREELIHAMMSAFRGGIIGSASEQRQDFKGMAAALDVAVGELLGDVSRGEWDPACVEESRSPDYTTTMTHSIARKVVAARRSRYLKPKSDLAVEAAGRTMLAEMDGFACKDGQVISDVAKKIVAAVRAADKSLA